MAGFMTHVTCRLTAKNRDQLWKVIEYGLPLPVYISYGRSVNTLARSTLCLSCIAVDYIVMQFGRVCVIITHTHTHTPV